MTCTMETIIRNARELQIHNVSIHRDVERGTISAAAAARAFRENVDRLVWWESQPQAARDAFNRHHALP